jgi:flagellar hook-length control protein FliK
MMDANLPLALPSRMIESRPLRDEGAKADEQTPESPFARALETAKERKSPHTDAESVNRPRAEQPRRGSDNQRAHPLHRQTVADDRAQQRGTEARPERLKSTAADPSLAQRSEREPSRDATTAPEMEKKEFAGDAIPVIAPTIAALIPSTSPEVALPAHKWPMPELADTVTGDDNITTDASPMGVASGIAPNAGRNGSVASDTASKSMPRGRALSTERSDATDGFSIRLANTPTAALATANSEAATVVLAGPSGRAAISSDSSTVKLADIPSSLALSGTPTTGSPAPSARADRLSLPMEAQPGAPAFSDELGTDIQLMIRDGFGKAELSLNPVDLGPIFIELKIREQVADISFSVTNPVTREAIEQSLPQLNEMLTHKGMSLGNSSVAGESAGNGRPRDDRAPVAGIETTHHTHRSPETLIGGPVATTGQRRLQIMAAAYARGGIDHYA